MVNKVILVGHVGQSPRFKEFESGAVCSISLATTKRLGTDENGNKREDITEWHNVVLYNALAKICNQYVNKGSRLYIEGELRYRSYDDKDGEKKYVTEIVAHQMVMLSAKKKDEKADSDDLPF